VTASFDKLASKTATTQRRKADGTGLEANLSGLKILPLMPVSAETAEAFGLASPRESKETYTRKHAHTDGGVPVDQLPDVVESDRLTVDAATYIVKAVGEWNDGTYDYRHLLMEQVKGT
jgi:hypothetical protein